MKSIINEENNDSLETTDTSCTDKDDTSHTNQDDSIENIEDMKNNNDDDEYKEDTAQHQDSNESVINKTKGEKSLIKQLMSMNLNQNVIQYVINIVTSCGKKK